MNELQKPAYETPEQKPEEHQPIENASTPETPENLSVTPANEPELVTASSLAEGELPEPSDHVIRDHVPAAPSEKTPLASEKLERTEKGIKDNSGRYFDPEKHQHKNGEPITSDKGYFRPWSRAHKKAGLHLKAEGFAGEEQQKEESIGLINRAKRLFGIEEKPSPTEPQESREAPPEANPQISAFPNGGLIGMPEATQSSESRQSSEPAEAAAAQFVAMEEMLAVMIFSEEWQFLPDEKKGLIAAWTRTFEEKGVVETPWWMELGAAHAVILANRADKPKTREKLGKMKASFMKKVIDLRTARAPSMTSQGKEVE
jgi:hypothetical protein